MKAKVLNPGSKRKTVKRKKKVSATRKRTSVKSVSKRKPVKRKVVRKKNPLKPQMKAAHNFISKIIIALESGHKVELEKKDLIRLRYILKNL